MILARLPTLPVFPGLAVGAGACACAWALVSLLWSPAPYLGLAHILSLAVAFVSGLFVPPRKAWMAFGLAATLAVLFNLRTPDVLNPNFLGAVCALGLIGAAAYTLWMVLPLLGVGLLFTQSRGAIVATGLTLFVIFWRAHRTLAYAAALGAILFVATVKGGPIGDSFAGRLGVWQDTLTHLTPLGTGWGGFADAYASWPRHTNAFDLRYAPHAYNDFLQVTLELGCGAVLVWAWIAVCLDRCAPHERWVPLCFLLLGLTYFPLWLPGPAQVFAFALGTAAVSTLRKPSWQSGAYVPRTI